MKPAIRVEGLSKSYRVTARRAGPNNLTENLLASGRRLWGLFRRLGRTGEDGHFWALKDVSFEVPRGQVVGIIGRNGAGKSTLLKILSRIVTPTAGRAEVRGRLGSLLEVGTGFHPELTGRENIYLNGSLLGMSHREITRKFDEIVAFSEIERFLDTPVKRYSSGMYVRLAFAVAAHLEPEVMVVDEVLAVGDHSFQDRCLGKMREVSEQGRTVLFVSHNLPAVKQLCQRVLVIARGQVLADADPATGIREYLAEGATLSGEWRDDRPEADAVGRLRAIRAVDPAGQSNTRFDPRQPITVEIDYELRRPCKAQVAFRVNAELGDTVFSTGDNDVLRRYVTEREPGVYRTRVRIPGDFLAPGRYHLLVAINPFGDRPIDVVETAVTFEVEMAGSLKQVEGRLGWVTPLLRWDEAERLAEVPPSGGA